MTIKRLFKNLRLLKRPVGELFGIAIVFSILFWILGWIANRQPEKYWVGLGIEIVVGTILTIVSTLAIVWKHGAVIHAMIRAREQHEIEPDGPLDAILEKSFADTIERVNLLRSSSGVEIIDKEELNKIVKACFDSEFDTYLAIDSHVPSVYHGEYPQFLDEHKVGLRSRKPGGLSWRILAVEPSDLESDYHDNRIYFEEFLKWHAENAVMLGQVSPEFAKGFSQTQQLQTVDMGLWRPGFAILFFPPKTRQKLKLRYLPPDNRLYNGCKLYFQSLAAADNVIKAGPSSILLEPRDRQERERALEALTNIS